MSQLSKDIQNILNNLEYPPTSEQEVCITTALKMNPFKIIAYAGSGKTSTLSMISKVLGSKGLKGLYLAFNKAIAAEAQTKFDSSVKCQTFHALAFKSVPYYLSGKTRKPRKFPKELAQIYNLTPETFKLSESELQEIKRRSNKNYLNVIGQGSNRYVSAAMKMQFINDAIGRFCKSADKEIGVKHFKSPDWMRAEDFDILAGKLLETAKKHWANLLSKDNEFNIAHDVYAKYWALTDPIISGYDYIMMDEMQDSDKLMGGILAAQKVPVFYVGDSNQAIYSFRGAINAIQNLDLPSTSLTKSFRFGEQIASHANALLSLLGETTPLVGFEKIDSKVYLNHDDDVEVNAILCRSNKGAFNELVRQMALHPNRPIAMNADIKEIRQWLEGAEKLRAGKTVHHPDLSYFLNWDEVIEYAELNKADNDFNYMVSLLNHFEFDFKELYSLLDNVNSDEKSAEIIISTVHKAKGREWDNVLISDDFNLELMTDKFAGINNRSNSLKEWRSENPDVYIENWELINFPESIKLYRNDGCIESQFKKYGTLNHEMRKQRYRITEVHDEEIRLVYVAITRAKKKLYAKNLADFFILIKKLEENLD